MESPGQLAVRHRHQHTALRHSALDEMLTEKIQVAQLQDLRDQIRVSVSNQVIRAIQKSAIISLVESLKRDQAWPNQSC